MNCIKKFLKRLLKLFELCIYHVLGVIPKCKKIWVFGSGFGYSDNSKYLFEEALLNHPEINAIWISLKKNDAKVLRQRGIKAYWNKSLKGFYYTLIAKVYVYTGRSNDIRFITSKSAFKFCLWHGALIKEIEFLITRGPLVKRYDNSLVSRIDFACCYQKPDLLLTMGQVSSKFLMKSMLVDSNHCVSNIYPRCKIFVQDKKSQLNCLRRTGGQSELLYDITRKYNKTYVYMPTFRDGRPDYLGEAHFDLQILNDALEAVNSYFILKVHPNTIPYLNISKDYSNIYIVRESFDIYPLLPFIDILITDYSSIYFDFLYLRKGIILFPFDLEQYVNEDRPFVINYNVDIKGVRANTFEQLVDLVKKCDDCKIAEAELDEMLEKYNSSSNIDLIEYVKQIINS